MSIVLLLALLLLHLPQTSYAATPISGQIYKDYNQNATRDTGATFNEPPVAGVVVNAYDATGALIETTTTAANGQYTLALPTINAGDRVRIEYTNLPDNLQPGPHAGGGTDGAGTTVRFVTSAGVAITGLDLPLTSVGDYCGASTNPNPTLITSCYVEGAQTGGRATIVSFPHDATGDLAGGGYTTLLNEAQSGSVYGIAYHPFVNQVFMTNIVKRHAGSIPNGGIGGTNLDTLYMYDLDAGGLLTFDLGSLSGANYGTDGRFNNGSGWEWRREIPASPFPSPINDNWRNPGLNGIGDIDISSDGRFLYVVNLFERQVETYTISYGTATATGGFTANPGGISLTYNGAFTAGLGCTNGIGRPYGLGYQDGAMYSGWVCTAETGGTAADLSAHVYRGNTLVFSMNLQFAATPNHRGCVAGDFPNRDCINARTVTPKIGDWRPRSLSFSFFGEMTVNVISGPEPILSDIEFDSNGDMILGFRDRHSDMVGNLAVSNPVVAATVPGGGSTLYQAISGGDMYRVCLVSGVYVLEGDPSGNCPRPGPGATYPPPIGTVDRDTNGDGPNGGEYYYGDNAARTHGEIYWGGLAQVAGRSEVVTTAMDPTDVVETGGIRRVNNTDGGGNAATSALVIGSRPLFGKANGIGDLEAVCPPPPLEIGNFVWIEDVSDGIQSTGTENTPAGVLLELIDPATGNVIAQATTDATGHYYFNATAAQWDTNGDGTFGDAPPFWDVTGNGTLDANEPQGIMPFTNYQVRVAASNFNAGNPLNGYQLTTVNVGSGTTENGNLISDSEALTVSVTTGMFGVNNHTLDFGFAPIPPTPTPTPTSTLTSTPTSTPTPTLTPTGTIVVTSPPNPPTSTPPDGTVVIVTAPPNPPGSTATLPSGVVVPPSGELTPIPTQDPFDQVTNLPGTGETPAWRTPLIVLIVSGMLGMLLSMLLAWRRWMR